MTSLPGPFPDISVCNLRNLNTDILNEINQMFKVDNEPFNHIDSSDNPFINEYMKLVAKFSPLWYQYQEEYPHMFQEVFSQGSFSANIAPNVSGKASVQLNQFISSCIINGRDCDFNKEFKYFFDHYFFNCYTFQLDHQSSNYKGMSEGVENGWSSIVFTGNGLLDVNEDVRIVPGTQHTQNPMSSSEGARIVIHPPNTKPFPLAEGFDVPPGFSASFGIKMRMNSRSSLVSF